MTTASKHSNTTGKLTLGAIGVVYGDIGTSPLYAFRESLAAASGHGNAPDPAVVLGILSLVLWSLFIIVTLKYVMLVLRADNQGEGGILSLMALAQNAVGKNSAIRYGAWISTLGMTGAALFYGDALITPAISVLSAMEGLKLVTPHFTPYILPLSLAIIIGLFVVQRRGTAKVAVFFGPIMALWFLVLAVGGLMHIQDSPEVWRAFNPYYGMHFLMHHGYAALITLGAVVLSITGAEALYADMGHFGRRPMRLAWIWFVMPALMLNYLGQAALVLSHPEAAGNSFYLLYPETMLLPMVILAGMATVIASQAVITGAFSLTHQAIQLGLLPRFHVQYTSEKQAGQIYLPKVNWLLLTGVALLILMFRNSGNLAAAYGIAVTGTMVITALMLFIVMRHVWRWSRPLALMVVAPFLIIDLAFLVANMTKVFDGGYVPLCMSAILIVMMRTWVRGSESLHQQTHHHSIHELLSELNHYPPQRVAGTAVYLTSNTNQAPTALLQNLKHNKVLHDQNIMLTLRFAKTPYVPDSERITTEVVSRDFTRVYMHYGFMETPNVTRGLTMLSQHNVRLDMMLTTFFVSRRSIVPSARFGMPLWQDRIFIAMARGASDAASYFHLPSSRVVELGVQMTV